MLPQASQHADLLQMFSISTQDYDDEEETFKQDDNQFSSVDANSNNLQFKKKTNLVFINNDGFNHQQEQQENTPSSFQDYKASLLHSDSLTSSYFRPTCLEYDLNQEIKNNNTSFIDETSSFSNSLLCNTEEHYDNNNNNTKNCFNNIRSRQPYLTLYNKNLFNSAMLSTSSSSSCYNNNINEEKPVPSHYLKTESFFLETQMDAQTTPVLCHHTTMDHHKIQTNYILQESHHNNNELFEPTTSYDDQFILNTNNNDVYKLPITIMNKPPALQTDPIQGHTCSAYQHCCHCGFYLSDDCRYCCMDNNDDVILNNSLDKDDLIQKHISTMGIPSSHFIESSIFLQTSITPNKKYDVLSSSILKNTFTTDTNELSTQCSQRNYNFETSPCVLKSKPMATCLCQCPCLKCKTCPFRRPYCKTTKTPLLSNTFSRCRNELCKNFHLKHSKNSHHMTTSATSSYKFRLIKNGKKSKLLLLSLWQNSCFKKYIPNLFKSNINSSSVYYKYDSRVIPNVPLSLIIQRILTMTELPFMILWIYFTYWAAIVAMTVPTSPVHVWLSAIVAGVLVGIGLNANAYKSIMIPHRCAPTVVSVKKRQETPLSLISTSVPAVSSIDHDSLSNSFCVESTRARNVLVDNITAKFETMIVDWGMVVRFFLIPFGVSCLSGITNSNRNDFLLVFPLDPYHLTIAIVCPIITILVLFMLRLCVLWKYKIRWSFHVLFLNGALVD